MSSGTMKINYSLSHLKLARFSSTKNSFFCELEIFIGIIMLESNYGESFSSADLNRF